MSARRSVGPLPAWGWVFAFVAGWLIARATSRDLHNERPDPGEAVEGGTIESSPFRPQAAEAIGAQPVGLRSLRDVMTGGGRRGFVVTAAAAVLAMLGAMAIGVAVASQGHAPQPPPSAAGSIGPGAGTAAIPAVRSTQRRVPKVVGPVLTRSKPVALDIPAIGVHSPLLRMGQTAQGTVEVPPPGPHYNEAAWYRFSPAPGSLGPAVILGHVDSAADGPSVFFNLGDLRPGNKILVHRADGLVAVFSVDGVRRFPKDGFPTRLVTATPTTPPFGWSPAAGPSTSRPAITWTTSWSSPHSPPPTRRREHLDIPESRPKW